MTRFKDRFSFVTMAALVFIALNLLLWACISTGPHAYLQLGLTGWLELHRYQSSWSVEHVSVVGLAIEIGLAFILTWILSIILRRLRYGSRSVA